MKLVITATALAGLAVPSLAGMSVFDLASQYEGSWVDPNFTDMGEPVGGTLTFNTSIFDPTPGDPGDETATWGMLLGGNPGGGPLPGFMASLAINAAGLIDVNNLEVPDLDGDLLFNTGGDFYATPTMSVSYGADGSLSIQAFNAAGFGVIDVYGTLTATDLLLTVDIRQATGAPISLGSTLEATAVPGQSSLLALLFAGGVLRRRRPALA